ncbi:MAG TPA: Ig-like domain-containing protein [Vicinamibacterales bacterium]|nr:Ig-like domain-containing protein [Vicinamibacterales bacterium]
MSCSWRPIALVSLFLGTAMSAGGRAQSAQLVSTSLSTIQRYPTFYHGRTVALIGAPEEIDGIWRIPIDATRTLIVLPRDGRPPSRAVELRGLLFDVGQLSQDDTRLSASGLRAVVETLSRDRWPARNTLFALTAATWVDEPSLTPPSVRTIALHPQAFDGKSVTVRGRFRAQNLYGDLPAWPRQSQWDFVLQAADAAIWVTGIRPRGRGFDLDPTTRRGAGAWLEAQGTIRFEDGLPRLEASTLATSKPESDAPPAVALPPPPLLPPPAVIFSAPLNNEADIDPTVVVRVQFSRDMKESSFEGAVKVTYAEPIAGPAPPFEVNYHSGTRAIEIRFKSPLASAVAVTVSFGAAITATDGTPMAPASITFRTKG